MPCFPLRFTICFYTGIIQCLPGLYIYHISAFFGEELNVIKRFKIESWKNFVTDYEIIYDMNNDFEDDESDGESEVIELDNGIIVIAPYDWN